VGVEEGRALVRGAFRAHVVGGECLDQSLVQYLLHRRDGLAVRLVVGVKRPDGGPGIEAHAWVEATGPDGGHPHAPGEPGSAPEDPTFVPLFVGEGA